MTAPGRRGRPLDVSVVVRILKLRLAEGMGYKRIARELGVGASTVRKYVKLYEDA